MPPRTKKPLLRRPSFRYLTSLFLLYIPYTYLLIKSPFRNPDIPLPFTILSYLPLYFLLGLAAGFGYYVPRWRAHVRRRAERKKAVSQGEALEKNGNDDDEVIAQQKHEKKGEGGTVAFPDRVASFFPPVRVPHPRIRVPLMRRSSRRHEPRVATIPYSDTDTEILFDAESELNRNSIDISEGSRRPHFPIADRTAALEAVEALREATRVIVHEFDVLDVKEALEWETRRRRLYLAEKEGRGAGRVHAESEGDDDVEVDASRPVAETCEFV